jgi:hypothetical protein
MKEPTPTQRTVLTFLNNADELITMCQKRKEARDVIRSLQAYAASKNYSLPDEKINNFLEVLLDARPQTLSYLLTDIAQDVVKKS